MRPDQRQFEVTRRVFYDERPMYVHLGSPEQALRLKWIYLAHLSTGSKLLGELHDYLGEKTSCPRDLLPALERTLWGECFLRSRNGGKRLADDNFFQVDRPREPSQRCILADGIAWLEQWGDTAEGLG